MKIPILYYPLLLLNNIILNPIKIILILIPFILIPNRNYFGEYSYEKTPIIKEMTYGDEYLYLYKTVSENQIKYEVLNFDTKQKIINGNLIDKDYSFFFYFSIVTSGISTIIFFILLYVDGWSFSEARLKTISRWIYCELEENVYYYFFDDRFLGKSDNDLKGKLYRLEVSSLSDIRLRPVFKTKSMKREDKLDELLK
jgi:hypothetical protein